MDTNKIFNEIKEKLAENNLGFDDSIVVEGNSLEVLKKIPDHSIALILTDPPYHSTKKINIIGDTSFNSDDEYIDWMEEYAKEWKRILKYNGSIFCFCSAVMSAKLQVMFSKYFNILSSITWTKPNAPGYDGWKQKTKKESLRQWYAHSERIIFMENSTEGNLFNSYFGAQLTKWRKSVKMTMKDLAEVTKSYGKVNHGGAVANWEAGRNIPSEVQYNKLKDALTEAGVEGIPDYNDIIRPFNVSKDVEFTDVWTFENVRQYKGKHPAEKPLDLLEHAIKATSYEGDIVLDCFSGSGATSVAAFRTKRKSISIEIDKSWCYRTVNRLEDESGCFLLNQNLSS